MPNAASQERSTPLEKNVAEFVNVATAVMAVRRR